MVEAKIEYTQRPSLVWTRLNRGEGLIGAEIGVQNGLNAFYLYNLLKPKHLYLIDCWDNFIDFDSGEIIGEAQYLKTYKILKDLPNVNIIRAKSFEVVNSFPDNSFDFIYIDADHRYESIKRDLALWYPKVKSKGVFCGHDFTPSVADNGIIRAIYEFAEQHKLILCVEQEDWRIIKL
jgi:predicted O-methyltransferase YrrM